MKTKTPANNSSLLVIFYRNPEIGKVKTRLAATLGDASALAIYLFIVAHTKMITENIPIDKAVYYSGHIDTEDNWQNSVYRKYLQIGGELGERMSNAFLHGFQSGYQSICIIGTDCYELTQNVIEEAFVRLQSHDVVIGPARDGGYYLLGMKVYYPSFFKAKEWSTDAVFKATIQDIKDLGLTHFVLPLLTDIDNEKDVPEALRKLI